MIRHSMPFVLGLVALVVAIPQDVSAQSEGGRASSAPRSRLVLDDFAVVGKIRKPQVTFLISRERGVSQEAIELKESFLPKIIDAVQQSPF